MYKIILTYKLKRFPVTQTNVFTYFNEEYCRKQLPILKDRYVSMGCIIYELKIYKVEQIADAEQI